MLSGSSVNEISCYCPGGCGYNILYISAYTGCHVLLMDACHQAPLILPKMQDQISLTLC